MEATNKDIRVIDICNLEARIEMQFSVVEPVLGKEAAILLTNKVMDIVRDEGISINTIEIDSDSNTKKPADC